MSSKVRKIATVSALVAAWMVALFLLGLTLKLSFGHIITAAHKLGVSPDQAPLAPLFLDGVAMAGKLLTLPLWSAKTRRTGVILMAIGGVGSFAANVYAGSTPGDRIFGGLTVGLFVLVEWAIGRVSLADATPAPAAKRERKPLTDEQKRERAAKAQARKAAQAQAIQDAAAALVAQQKADANEARKARAARKADAANELVAVL